jgi:arsenite methyltransferase
MNLNLSLLGWPHALACIVAMVAFFPAMFARKGNRTHRRWGKIYAVAYVILCITALGIYRGNRFFFPHWLSIAGLVVLGLGYWAVRYKPRGWRVIHLVAMLLTAENLFGGLVNEAFLRVNALQAIGGIRSPMVGAFQALVGNSFLILIVGYLATLNLAEWRRYPRAATLPPKRADYGIDAPAVVRNLILVAIAGIGLGTFLPVRALASMTFGTGVLCFGMTLWMLWESKVGKLLERERLLRRIDWTGNEHVLDVGCGRGLLLIGAAKRLRNGRATGIDLWQAKDLTGNTAAAAIENARREGVDDRVEVHTADMRKLPFPDSSFDVIVSRAAIHNIYSVDERAHAVREIARVLRPGGQAVIDDIRHMQEYARVFAQNGCKDLRRAGSLFSYVVLGLVTFGSVRPGTLLVRKSA